ncbi:hypothetical protein HZH66_000903 [Vespula vulgaris]|uniref:Uncharacterized protein n=1 Tax=Vespula vulgaris TaxID=7454 RepID=A0A834NJS7_VESVU|nr:hypothetical protein HZH66_000903 [Vespula vulgaris]
MRDTKRVLTRRHDGGGEEGNCGGQLRRATEEGRLARPARHSIVHKCRVRVSRRKSDEYDNENEGMRFKKIEEKRRNQTVSAKAYDTLFVNFSVPFQIIRFTKKVGSSDSLDRNLNPAISLFV